MPYKERDTVGSVCYIVIWIAVLSMTFFPVYMSYDSGDMEYLWWCPLTIGIGVFGHWMFRRIERSYDV